MKVSLARLYYPVKVLGPGNRVGIWLNGCDKACPGCISPDLQYYDESKEVLVEDIKAMLDRIHARIDGFTISGGEPFYRPEGLRALVEFLARIHEDILIFSGYTLEELRNKKNEDVDAVLGLCAALIDGPYIKNLNDNRGLRGSSNQRIIVFKYSEKYLGLETQERGLQNVVYGNGVLTIGIPTGGE